MDILVEGNEPGIGQAEIVIAQKHLILDGQLLHELTVPVGGVCVDSGLLRKIQKHALGEHGVHRDVGVGHDHLIAVISRLPGGAEVVDQIDIRRVDEVEVHTQMLADDDVSLNGGILQDSTRHILLGEIVIGIVDPVAVHDIEIAVIVLLFNIGRGDLGLGLLHGGASPRSSGLPGGRLNAAGYCSEQKNSR